MKKNIRKQLGLFLKDHLTETDHISKIIRWNAANTFGVYFFAENDYYFYFNTIRW